MSPSPRRFIAGAICPACGQLDKLVVYMDQDRKFFECVKCGHKEEEKPVVVERGTPKSPPGQHILNFVPMKKKTPLL